MHIRSAVKDRSDGEWDILLTRRRPLIQPFWRTEKRITSTPSDRLDL